LELRISDPHGLSEGRADSTDAGLDAIPVSGIEDSDQEPL
jgi:hypothetical protein